MIMAKAETKDEVLAELWAIKDATARRFRSATAYFAHLRNEPVARRNLKQAMTAPLKVRKTTTRTATTGHATPKN
jgi:hypothetical protein